ncbi:hypothetical protein MES4922_190404 [Mesorhizobium ventifaucium]|uniref:Uncharacterized protein n=1 Tax=Mesorhizobium ventifaucium TaxID=666020 RepID=A0ABM9DMA9_9HYPH|nr:hypothetical protein MES4922_190404 [Mesorhizobium ventifaucium]
MTGLRGMLSDSGQLDGTALVSPRGNPTTLMADGGQPTCTRRYAAHGLLQIRRTSPELDFRAYLAFWTCAVSLISSFPSKGVSPN